MDALDQILLDAWNRIGGELRKKRIRALKRSRRRFMGVLTRPMREWCLVIRASDTRINSATALVALSEESSATPVPESLDLIEAHLPHTLTLDGALIRKLTKPVMIDWPGVTYEEAARRCGREYQTIKNWVRKGVFKIERYPEFKFPRKKTNSRGKGRAGGEGRPYLWTPSPIDPNNFDGQRPHKVWGTLWQSLWEQLPQEYELAVQRVPKFRMFRGKDTFRGWDFVCPGRLDENGNYKGCGRRCTYLYAPQTVWTLARALCANDNDETGFAMPADSGLAGRWHPGESDPIEAACGAAGRSFACKMCWGVRSACMANYNGWNEFIAQISGGLLYGRDVTRPQDICPVKRKKREYQWKKRLANAAPEREKMVS